MKIPNANPKLMSPLAAWLLLAAPLLPVVQLLSGNPFSNGWYLTDGAISLLCILYAVVFPWISAIGIRSMRQRLEKSHSKGIVQIVALRASDSRYRRLAILQVDSSGIEKVEPNESVASISWTSILNITQTQSANFGQASIVVMGKNGESLLDFIPMGKAGIHRLGAGRVDEFVKRIEHVRKLH